jgi:hypothetical protein
MVARTLDARSRLRQARGMEPLRASDRLRAGTIAALRRGYLDGRMSTETFEARIAVAHRAGHARTLRALRADLGARWRAVHALLDGARAAGLARVAAEPPPQATLLLSRTALTEITVGRASSATLRFGTSAVSRHHVLFERMGSEWYATDLSSTNGTFVDGVRVQRAPVGPGAEVRLGDAYILIA